jgi:hypothetical protein
LVEQLSKAADATMAAGSHMTAAAGTKDFASALQANTELRNRYLEISERLRQHRQLAHPCAFRS